MKRNFYEYPKSSFLGMSKDTSLIMDKILGNQDVLKLLYYNVKDWQKKPNLASEQIKSLFEQKNISNIPKIVVNSDKLNYIRITYDSFTPNASNPYYRDHVVEIKIICHFANWDLGDYELRPYRIAGEIDSMLDGQHLTGIGVLNFMGADQDVYDDEFGGITLRYLAVRGHEDEVNPLE